MRMRCSVMGALALAAGAGAQPMYVLYELSVQELGNGNSSLEPGESAQVVLHATVHPPVGTQVMYTPPPGTGVGTVAGLGSVWFDLKGLCGTGIAGVWTLSGPGFVGTTGANFGRRTGWALGSVGVPQESGAVHDAQAGQFPLPGQTANATNPVAEIWRGRWMPNSYTPGWRFFQAAAPAGAGSTHATVLVRFGTDPGGNPLYTFVDVPSFYRSAGILIGQPQSSWCLCYANCDHSQSSQPLNVNDLVCFQARFAAGDPYADCDQSGTLNVNDFVCFQGRFAGGCP